MKNNYIRAVPLCPFLSGRGSLAIPSPLAPTPVCTGLSPCAGIAVKTTARLAACRAVLMTPATPAPPRAGEHPCCQLHQEGGFQDLELKMGLKHPRVTAFKAWRYLQPVLNSEWGLGAEHGVLLVLWGFPGGHAISWQVTGPHLSCLLSFLSQPQFTLVSNQLNWAK